MTVCFTFHFYIHFQITGIKVRIIRQPRTTRHSSTLAWRIPWTEEPGRLQSMGSLESGTTERLHFHFSLSCIREGNGNPLQCSCLENPRDRGACWAAFYGVARSRTWLTQLSSSSRHQIGMSTSSRSFQLTERERDPYLNWLNAISTINE